MSPPKFNISDFQPSGSDVVLPVACHVKDEEHGWIFGNHPALSSAQQSELKAMLIEEKSAFAYSMQDLQGYNGERGPFAFDLTSDDAEFSKPRRHSPLEEKVVNEKCGEMQDVGLIVRCPTSHYASATVLPAKKDPDGQWTDHRFCVDFRPLNAKMLQTNISCTGLRICVCAEPSSICTKIDLRAGFHRWISIASEAMDSQRISPKQLSGGGKICLCTPRCLLAAKMPVHTVNAQWIMRLQRQGCRSFVFASLMICWCLVTTQQSTSGTCALCCTC